MSLAERLRYFLEDGKVIVPWWWEVLDDPYHDQNWAPIYVGRPRSRSELDRVAILRSDATVRGLATGLTVVPVTVAAQPHHFEQWGATWILSVEIACYHDDELIIRQTLKAVEMAKLQNDI